MRFRKVCVFIIGFLVLFVNYRIKKFNRNYLKELEGFKDEVEMVIVKDGYKCEIFEVTTDDGYVLKVHRVMSKKDGKRSQKYPVFLMHGLYGSSINYLLSGPEHALAYNLVDNGFDVWMGNSRETRNSIRLDSKPYWSFSFSEIGLFDFPAIIDGILKQTHKSKLYFIGFSHAANCLLVLLSSIPEYNEKIIQAHTMAPVVFIEKRHFLPMATKQLLDQIMVQFLPGSLELSSIFAIFCPIESGNAMNFLCKMILKQFFAHTEETKMEILATHWKLAAPVLCFKQFHHHLQLHLNGKFRRFDYGKDNLRIYNTSSPPDYQLSNVKVPLYIYHADEDTTKLRNLLSDVIKEYRVIAGFGNVDLIYGNSSRSVLYGDIIKFMNDYV